MICLGIAVFCCAEDMKTDDDRLFAPFIDPETARILEADGEITRIIKKGENLTLVPETDNRKRMEEEIKKMNPLIGVEILILHTSKKTDIAETPEHNLLLYNTLRSISTLKGIRYYSASRKRMRIFYHDAYVIETPASRKRIPDPLVKTIPANDRLYAFFKDSSFGDYTCEIEYSSNERCHFMKMENLTLIWYLFIPIIDPHNLRSYIIMIPEGNHILFYGFSCLESSNPFGIAEGRIESLTNRIKAIYNWFDGRFEEK